MGWWSDLFKVKDVVIDSGFPKVSTTTSMADVKPPKPEKDISEPVISFVECVRNNPERFRIKCEQVLDRKTQTKFTIHQRYIGYIGDGKYLYHYSRQENTNWMTDDEMEYAYLQLEFIQKEKAKNFKNKQRQKYIDIYVTKENDQ